MIKYSHRSIKNLLVKTFSVYFGIVVVCMLTAYIFSIRSIKKLNNFEISQASSSAKIAIVPLQLLRILTLNQVHQLDTWEAGLLTITTMPEIEQVLKDVVISFSNPDQSIFSPDAVNSLKKANELFQDFYQLFTQDSFAQASLSQSKKDQLAQISQNLPQIITLCEFFSSNSVNILLLLQNNDEIRASGGFMGSLASINVSQGSLKEPVFYDIYDLANRVERVPDPPIGVKRYLSSGRGLALTDANWEADFSQSATKIQQMVQNTELAKPDIIVAINLDLLREILLATGPVTIPDFQQEVYADNLAELARQNRLEFFSGDKQKKIFLQQIYQALKIKIQQLSIQEQSQLFHTIYQSIQHKNILIYSSNFDLQELAAKLQASGSLSFSTDYFLYILESNVGINKANQAVSREVKIAFKPDLITINIEFFNNNQPLSESEIEKIRANQDLNQAEHLGYVNYQRILTELPIKQAQIICNGNQIELEEETRIQTSQGEVNQFGFLLTVPEQNSTRCTISLQPATELSHLLTWTVVKQPGLPPTPYVIDFFDKEEQLILNQDYLIPKL